MIIADIDGCRVMPATAINTTIQATTTIAFRPISPFGTPKIAIPGDPRFSSRYTVRGHDTNAVRRIFTPQVLAAMGNYPLFFMKGSGDYLYIYANRTLAPLGQVRSGIEFIVYMHRVFQSR